MMEGSGSVQIMTGPDPGPKNLQILWMRIHKTASEAPQLPMYPISISCTGGNYLMTLESSLQQQKVVGVRYLLQTKVKPKQKKFLHPISRY
jgi:hypothetical protein